MNLNMPGLGSAYLIAEYKLSEPGQLGDAGRCPSSAPELAAHVQSGAGTPPKRSPLLRFVREYEGMCILTGLHQG